MVNADWTESVENLAAVRKYLYDSSIEFGWNQYEADGKTSVVFVEQPYNVVGKHKLSKAGGTESIELNTRVRFHVWNNCTVAQLQSKLLQLAIAQPVRGVPPANYVEENGKRWPLIAELLAWWLFYRMDLGTPAEQPQELQQWVAEFHKNPPVAIHAILYNEYEEFRTLFTDTNAK